jgi:hypothetical protein
MIISDPGLTTGGSLSVRCLVVLQRVGFAWKGWQLANASDKEDHISDSDAVQGLIR